MRRRLDRAGRGLLDLRDDARAASSSESSTAVVSSSSSRRSAAATSASNSLRDVLDLADPPLLHEQEERVADELVRRRGEVA